MRLNFRDLKQVKWHLEVDPSDTVALIKQKNAKEREFDDSIAQKLIYSGRILKDDEAISTYEIDEEKGFIVCMTSKKKKVEPKAEQVKSAEPKNEPKTNAEAPTTTATPSSGLPSVPDNAIESMMEMGYDRPVVLTALRMAYNNPDRAVEFLLNGQAQELRERSATFYEGESGPDSAAGAAAAGAEAGESGHHDDPQSEIDTTDVNLFDSAPREDAQLTEMPEDIRQLRQLVRENPSIMEPLIQQLAEQNPMLAEAITQNIDEFLGEGEGDEHDDQYENTATIEVTPEENEAIGRLVELGFDRNLVIQAYFACDKDENLTANYLFEHGHED